MKNNRSKLKKWVLVFIAIPSFSVFIISLSLGTETRLSVKMDQVIKKMWKDKKVDRVALLIPGNLKTGESTELFKLTTQNEIIAYMVLNKAFSCKVGGCSAWAPVKQQSNFEPFYYVVIISPDLTIAKIKVIEYYSEYGYEITSTNWLAQFIGKTGCNLEYKKKIDGISGATISVKSMIYDIDATCKMMEQLEVLNILH